jgi:hypothetical protein
MKVRLCALGASFVLAACGHSRPATHVELVDEGGGKTWVAGAAGSGLNKSLACEMALSRSVQALAEKYADEGGLTDDVGKALNLDDAKPLVYRYAHDAALGAAVQDMQFDPVEHLCMAVIRWRPPAFAKDAIIQFAEKVRQAELGGHETQAAPPASAAAPAAPAPVAAPPPAPVYVAQPSAASPSARPAAPGPTPEPTAASSPSAEAPAPAPVVAAPAPAAVAAQASAVSSAPPPACTAERRGLDKALYGGRKAEADFQECLDRTSNDAKVCVRYKMYVDEAKEKQSKAAAGLSRCLNRPLSTKLRQAVNTALPGYAARAIETRPDGTLVLWTLSPLDQTAFALEVGADGQPAAKSPLAANQVQWLKGQLGL